MDDFQAKTDELIQAIIKRPETIQQNLGLMILTATQFVGAGGALLARISKEKGGPELDDVGWSEEITKMIIRESKKSLRH